MPATHELLEPHEGRSYKIQKGKATVMTGGYGGTGAVAGRDILPSYHYTEKVLWLCLRDAVSCSLASTHSRDMSKPVQSDI